VTRRTAELSAKSASQKLYVVSSVCEHPSAVLSVDNLLSIAKDAYLTDRVVDWIANMIGNRVSKIKLHGIVQKSMNVNVK